MPKIEQPQKVSLRIDLPNVKKPFFNRVTSLNNALDKIINSEKELKADESAKIRIGQNTNTFTKAEIKDFTAEKILNVLGSGQEHKEQVVTNAEPKYNLLVALVESSGEEFKKGESVEFKNISFDELKDKMLNNNVVDLVFRSYPKDQINFSYHLYDGKIGEPLTKEMKFENISFNSIEEKLLREASGAIADTYLNFSINNEKYSVQHDNIIELLNNIKNNQNSKIMGKEGFDQLNYLKNTDEKKQFFKFDTKSDNGFSFATVLPVNAELSSAFKNLVDAKEEFGRNQQLKIEIGEITSKMSEPQKQSFEFLSNHLKYLGFGENLQMQSELAKNIHSDKADFSIKHISDKGYFKSNVITFDIKFHKSETSDKVFLNSYDVNLKNEKANKDLNHNFNVSKYGFTQKEAVNLIEGRSVKTDLKLKNGNTEKDVFIRLNFAEKETNGNFKTKKFFENYGVNTANILQKNSIYFKDEELKEKIVKSLEKGNVVPVLQKNNEGKLQNYNAILSPESKSLQLYNHRMERVNINETLSNSAKVENVESNTQKSQYTNKLTP